MLDAKARIALLTVVAAGAVAVSVATSHEAEPVVSPVTARATTPASTTARTTPATPAAAQIVIDGQSSARVLVSMVESCYVEHADYRRCRAPIPGSLGGNTGLKVVQRHPKPGEVRVISRKRETYRAVAVDANGTQWFITKQATGVITRTCRVASGEPCRPSYW